MSDLYSALIGAPVDTSEKQAALAELLRRRAGFANVAQMTGDAVLAPQGQQQAEAVQSQAKQVLASTLAARQAQADQQKEARMASSQQEQLGLMRRGQDMDFAMNAAKLAQDRADAAAKLAQDRADAAAKLAAASNKPPTEGQAGARAYLDRMQAAEGLLGGYTPSTKDFVAASNIYGGGGALTSALASNVMSKEGQKYYQAAADWVRAKLRKESGAAIGKEEMQQEIRTYFPMPGEGPEQIAQKAQARKQAEAQMGMMGGLTSVPEPEIKKVMGGVGYTKRGGKWYAD